MGYYYFIETLSSMWNLTNTKKNPYRIFKENGRPLERSPKENKRDMRMIGWSPQRWCRKCVYDLCVLVLCICYWQQCIWLSTQQWTIQHDSLSWLVSDWLGTCWDISISGSSLPQITTTRRRKMIYGGELRHHGRYGGDNSLWAFRFVRWVKDYDW